MRKFAHSPARSCAPRRLSGLIAWLVLVAAGPVLAGGVAFLPGASREAAVKSRPSLDLLTWDLPEGMLVADRTGPPGEVRLGTAFRPAYPRSEWFLVEPRVGRDRAGASTAELSAYGKVHFSGATAALVEVPVENLAAFVTRDFGVTHIPLTPAPPDGRTRDAAAITTTSAPVDSALKRAFIDSVSLPALNRVLQEISGYATFWYQGQWRSVETRRANTPGYTLAGDYLMSMLAGWGYTVAADSFALQIGGSGEWLLGRNVVATRTGSTTPDEVFVVGGHLDSYAHCGTECNAPGAEDNGTGSSLVMELARISRLRQFDRTVQFVLFDQEETGGRFGSAHFVADAVRAGRNVVGAVITDMVGWYGNDFGLYIEGEPSWEPLMSVMASNLTQYATCMYVKKYRSSGSDHVSFQQAGIPAFMAIEYDYPSYPYYHTSDDTWDKLQDTMPLCLQIARATAATLADVAGLRPDWTGESPAAVAGLRLAAWPNPANPRTTLRFDLPAAGCVLLRVYDLGGRLLREIVNGQFTAGRHEVAWDGRDAGGRQMASGSYFARLVAGGRVATARLGLVR